MSLLEAFTHGRPELRVSDLAELSGVGLSTTSRLVATLEALGWVERSPDSGLYRLGTPAITLAGVAVNQRPVHREARQIAQDLACELGLGVNVAERQAETLFYLLNFEGRLAPRSFVLTGQRNPLHATALGKCLLLALGGDERRALLPEQTLRSFTQNTLTDHARLDRELGEIAERGFARELEELALGRACVAAPIRDRTERIVAAMSISGSLSALDLERREAELGRRVIEAADAISVRLGYLSPTAMPAEVRG